MLTFPNAKINIGLNITEKRPDGYHNLETIFYPIELCDALEFIKQLYDIIVNDNAEAYYNPTTEKPYKTMRLIISICTNCWMQKKPWISI